MRDAAADARDVTALSRDRASDARGLVMTDRDTAAAHDGARAVTGAQVVLRAGLQRKRAAHDRARGAEHRFLADADQRAAALDREFAATDRMLALADREAFARLLAIMETDPLTGARTRLAGLNDLDREIARCRRTSGLLVVAYVDVVGLKVVNDSRGHAAGDALLKRVVTRIVAHLRSYDLIVRVGGDEFLCAMSNMTIEGARRRFEMIATELAAEPDAPAVCAGFARLIPDETVAQLIGRADRDLIDNRVHDPRTA